MTPQDIAARLSAMLTGLGSNTQASFHISAPGYTSKPTCTVALHVYLDGLLSEPLTERQSGAENIEALFDGMERRLLATHRERREATIERLADDILTSLLLYGFCHFNNLKAKNWDIHDVFKFKDAALDIVGRRLHMVGSPLTPTIIMPEPVSIPEEASNAS